MAKQQSEAPKHYWDACIFTSYIDNIPGRADVIQVLLDQCRNGDTIVYTSMVSIAEVAYATREKGRIDSEIEDRIDAFWMPPTRIKLVEFHELIARDARALIRSVVADIQKKARKQGVGLRAYDAVHLVTAKRCGVLRFSTYDNKLKKYEQRMGFNIGPPSLPAPPRKVVPEPDLFTQGSSDGSRALQPQANGVGTIPSSSQAHVDGEAVRRVEDGSEAPADQAKDPAQEEVTAPTTTAPKTDKPA